MKRRGFIGSLLAMLGVGAARAESKPAEPQWATAKDASRRAQRKEVDGWSRYLFCPKEKGFILDGKFVECCRETVKEPVYSDNGRKIGTRVTVRFLTYDLSESVDGNAWSYMEPV